ncbi:MAG: apolipoprotein N-acyltransferase, partial [Candidatus Omnitrophota bacterium]|nr:apolipoprotein N-acyltransferase [Candidatus Omnitrophota bacterium]
MKAKSSDPVSLPLSVRIKSLLAHLSLALVSAGLMVLAYPKTDAWPLAWFGLVPLLLALDGKRPGAAYGLGWVFGCAFFGGTLYWLMHVTGFGMALLVMFLANYIGLFALGHSLWRKRPLMEKIFLYPALWTALEFIRDRFLSGFGWASLGHSQYLFLPVIQMADITGMFGVSFLVLMANVAIKETLRPSGGRRESRKAGLTLAMILAAVLVYGVFRLNPAKPDPTLRVAIVQPNIPQEMKWQSSAWPVNMEKMKELTLRAAETRPDLIIWPETSYPGYIWDSPALYEDMKQFMAGVKVPLLFGAHTKIGDSYFNSAVLFDSAGQETAQYDKLHLVPFGEYLPLRRAWPFLEEIVPIEDFTAGRKQTVFTIPDGKGQTLSVLICFEDTMARLAREFVNS